MKNNPLHKTVFEILLFGLLFLTTANILELQAQVEATEKRYIRIGSLQSHFSAYGTERAWNNRYYEGLRWPAEYTQQDNAVIKRFWIASDDFTDELGNLWDVMALYFSAGFVGETIFPVELKQTAKFEMPTVIVDGNNITAPYFEDIDDYNPDQIPDRVITNVVNTIMGVTVTRKIYAFSQQYHDNYFIKEFTFTNTGNTDYDDEIELNAPIKGLRIGWGTRYSVCREGAQYIHSQQVWGKHSWVTVRGENYSEHYNEPITLNNPIVDWIRCGFQWAGQYSGNSWDNLGGPDVFGTGRLTAPHHAGVAILHVDKSATDSTDDPDQPVTLGWHAGDTYPGYTSISLNVVPQMVQIYSMLSGNPHKGLGGNERFYEKYVDTNPDPWTVHNDQGGTNLWVNYGPFDLQPGESVTIVEVEGVSGLNRTLCEQIGARWKKAYDDPNDKGPFELPDGTTTDDKDIYKNAWFDTGKDSILLTFSRAKRNYDMHYMIPQPPLPPPLFEVKSGGNKITLKWSPSPSEGEPDFGGYRIYRAINKSDTVHSEIFACGKGTEHPEIVHSFDDTTPVRGFAYYYYIVAFNDGSNNNTDANPHGPLHSSKYYTRTTEPAFLQRPPGEKLSDIRIVPNPYYISSPKGSHFSIEDEIRFYNIPGECTIRIFTERGDLIKTIIHDDGSGDEVWNSVTDSRQVIVSGIYIVQFETPDGQSIYKKFAVIR